MTAVLRSVPNAPAEEITIPDTIDGVRSTADAFLSTGWTLAAAVWAWTDDTGTGGHPGKKLPGSKYSISAFAALEIRGMKSRQVVRKYRAIWQSAIDSGHATSVAPGETVEMPDVPFGLITDDETPAPPKGGGGGTPRRGDEEVWDDDAPDGDESPGGYQQTPLEEMMRLANDIDKAMARIHTLATSQALQADGRTTFESITRSSKRYKGMIHD